MSEKLSLLSLCFYSCHDTRNSILDWKSGVGGWVLCLGQLQAGGHVQDAQVGLVKPAAAFGLAMMDMSFLSHSCRCNCRCHCCHCCCCVVFAVVVFAAAAAVVVVVVVVAAAAAAAVAVVVIVVVVVVVVAAAAVATTYYSAATGMIIFVVVIAAATVVRTVLYVFTGDSNSLCTIPSACRADSAPESFPALRRRHQPRWRTTRCVRAPCCST